ncbi:MAG: SPOR domain-containing protein [Treponema sp.]|jgi:hypothetical protein|nr:SPOR domain-containing protein [Treponema sp.]
MKRHLGTVLPLIGVLVFCTGATIWEGSASVSREGELPRTGLYIKTNYLPKDTSVELINPATGQSIKVTVVDTLEAPGLLAMLSPEAADRIGLSGKTAGKIRLTVSQDSGAALSFSEIQGKEGYVGVGNGGIPADTGGVPEEKPDVSGVSEETGSEADTADTADTGVTGEKTDGGDVSEETGPNGTVDTGVAEEKPAPPEWPYNDGAYEFSLVPAEERPPVGGVPQEKPAPPPVKTAEARFSAPVIKELENGKYYLQLGAYRVVASVEPELARIGTTFPLLVQEADSSGQPLYRILLGPLSRGEGGALLRRFKDGGYQDAFIRRGTLSAAAR